MVSRPRTRPALTSGLTIQKVVSSAMAVRQLFFISMNKVTPLKSSSTRISLTMPTGMPLYMTTDLPAVIPSAFAK